MQGLLRYVLKSVCLNGLSLRRLALGFEHFKPLNGNDKGSIGSRFFSVGESLRCDCNGESSQDSKAQRLQRLFKVMGRKMSLVHLQHIGPMWESNAKIESEPSSEGDKVLGCKQASRQPSKFMGAWERLKSTGYIAQSWTTLKDSGGVKPPPLVAGGCKSIRLRRKVRQAAELA